MITMLSFISIWIQLRSTCIKHDYLQKRPKMAAKKWKSHFPGSYGSYIHNKLTKWKCIDQNQIFIYLIYFLFSFEINYIQWSEEVRNKNVFVEPNDQSQTRLHFSVSFIFIRKYDKRRMPIDMLKRQCSGWATTEEWEKGTGMFG